MQNLSAASQVNDNDARIVLASHISNWTKKGSDKLKDVK